MRKILVFLLILFSAMQVSIAQDRFEQLEQRLRSLTVDAPGLNEKVDLSVNGVGLQDFIRSIAISNNLNVTVDPAINIKVVNNFTNVSVVDVFLFLCRKYSLDVNFIGSIMSFVPYRDVVPEAPKPQPKSLNITYDKAKDLISFDLNNDSLSSVAKQLTMVTDKNIILAPEVRNKPVSGYIRAMTLKQALEKLAVSNDLKFSSDEGIFVFEKQEEAKPKSGDRSKTATALPAGLSVKVAPGNLISVDAVNVPSSDILANVSKQLGINYILFSELKGNSTLTITNSTYPSFLKYLLNGTDFTFKYQDSLYLVGDRNLEGLRSTKVVQMKYRTVDNIIDFIPADIKKGVDIKTFSDQNALILSGSQPRILEIESFLRDVDKVVPVILIEVIIVNISDNKVLETVFKAGIGTSPAAPSNGTLFPDYNMQYDANSVNSLMNKLSSYGMVNLGKVTPNFYLNIKALETQGYLKVNSTPKLATLNGHEATMTIGETQFYQETQNNVIGTLTPQSFQSIQFKPLEANLKLTVSPTVSADEQITMDISFSQSSFTTRVSTTGPFGTSKKDFKSLIRVRNEETVVLGGLQEDKVSETSSGVPFLSRIPLLKWLFSSRNRNNTKSKLTIFIKPTIMY